MNINKICIYLFILTAGVSPSIVNSSDETSDSKKLAYAQTFGQALPGLNKSAEALPLQKLAPAKAIDSNKKLGNEPVPKITLAINNDTNRSNRWDWDMTTISGLTALTAATIAVIIYIRNQK